MDRGAARGVLFVASLTLGSAIVKAQSNPSGDELIPGSIERAAVSEAAIKNAQLYGAAGFLDRVLSPRLNKPGTSVILAETSNIQGLLRVPANMPAACGSRDGCPYGLLDVDAFSAAGGVGFRGEHVSLFYVSSWTGMRLSESGTEIMAPFWVAGMAGLGFFNLYTAPLYTGPTKIMDGWSSILELSSQDYIVGGGLHFDVAGLSFGGRAGFLGTANGGGAYLRLEEGVTSLVGSAVFRTETNDLPYIVLGLQSSTFVAGLLGLPRSAAEADGAQTAVSLYVRSLALAPLSGVPGSVESKSTMRTAHVAVEQYPFGSDMTVSVSAALGVSPSPFVHELRASTFYGDLRDGSGFSFSLGYTGMPRMSYYGRDGSGGLSYGVEAHFASWELALRRNDSDLLSRFPFAGSTTQIYLSYDPSGLFE